jgi:hypothetical protein
MNIMHGGIISWLPVLRRLAAALQSGNFHFGAEPARLLSVASPWWVSNKSHKGSSCRRNAKLICNGHGVCGTYVPHHCSPIVVWTHSNDCVAIHTHVGYEMGRYTS